MLITDNTFQGRVHTDQKRALHKDKFRSSSVDVSPDFRGYRMIDWYQRDLEMEGKLVLLSHLVSVEDGLNRCFTG